MIQNYREWLIRRIGGTLFINRQTYQCLILIGLHRFDRDIYYIEESFKKNKKTGHLVYRF